MVGGLGILFITIYLLAKTQTYMRGVRFISDELQLLI